MSPETPDRHDAAARRAPWWRRVTGRLRRFLFEQEPGFLPTRHLDDAGEPGPDRS